MVDRSESQTSKITNYGDAGFSTFLRGVFLASAGWDPNDLDRPIIGIANTESDFNPCHRMSPGLVENIKRGILEAGGVPFVFPTMSLGETLLNPTSMYLRNLMAIETEELILSQPMDGVVLVGGCDKTVPAQAMAAISADIPALLEVVGPMLTSTWQGNRVGACTDCRRIWAGYRAEEVSEPELVEAQNSLATTGGTCMVMGTASTMASTMETLGLILPGGATPPSPTGDRLRHGTITGRQIVEMVKQGTKPSSFLSKGSFINAITVLAAIGGSTNAVVHLLAIANRAQVGVTLDDFEEVFKRTPLLLDLKPSGSGYMEDFHSAGGIPQLLHQLSSLLDLNAKFPTNETLGELLDQKPVQWQNDRVIRSIESPALPAPTLAVIKGNLAPDGAIIKVSAASEKFFDHTGPAVVFDSPTEVAEYMESSQEGVTENHVLVLRNSGPVGAGMPEAGSMAIPRSLATQGIKDIVRVSDARMSGTSYGTVILHCAPESAVGGLLSVVENNDQIHFDLESRRLDLLVDEDEISKRQSNSTPPLPSPGAERRWRKIQSTFVSQANLGADLDIP